MIKRILREPLAHFLLLGALIFAVHAWRGKDGTETSTKDRIEVTAGTLAWLGEGFSKQWHRAPDEAELRGMVNDHIREEVLYREALAMGLDRNDTIVRRRLAQKMEFLSQDIAATVEPDEAALREYFNCKKGLSLRKEALHRIHRLASLRPCACAASRPLLSSRSPTTTASPAWWIVSSS